MSCASRATQHCTPFSQDTPPHGAIGCCFEKRTAEIRIHATKASWHTRHPYEMPFPLCRPSSDGSFKPGTRRSSILGSGSRDRHNGRRAESTPTTTSHQRKSKPSCKRPSGFRILVPLNLMFHYSLSRNDVTLSIHRTQSQRRRLPHFGCCSRTGSDECDVHSTVRPHSQVKSRNCSIYRAHPCDGRSLK